jgi:hypothetical protein
MKDSIGGNGSLHSGDGGYAGGSYPPSHFSLLPGVFPPRVAKKILAIVKWEFYLAVQTTVHRFCTFNGSVDSEGLLWNGQQVLVTAAIVEGQHPLPGLLAIKRQ